MIVDVSIVSVIGVVIVFLVGIFTDARIKKQKLKLQIIEQEVELEKLKLETYTKETEKMRLELEHSKVLLLEEKKNTTR